MARRGNPRLTMNRINDQRSQSEETNKNLEFFKRNPDFPKGYLPADMLAVYQRHVLFDERVKGPDDQTVLNAAWSYIKEHCMEEFLTTRKRK